MPESVNYGPRLESHNGTTRCVYNTFQYVSVEKTLRGLLTNELYVRALLQNDCHPDIISDFKDGTRFKEHYLFGDCTKLSLMLQLFYDGLGVTNPLRSGGSVHNVAVFYYTLKNLPLQYRACFGNVHLLALTYSIAKFLGHSPLFFSYLGPPIINPRFIIIFTYPFSFNTCCYKYCV